MTPNNRRFPLAFLVALLAMAPVLHASVAELATFDEKVENAAAIVLGKCVKTESRWDDQHRWILTYSTFRIEKVMKGSPSLGDLTIVTPGGSVDGLHQETIGIPAFHTGDERLLFVKSTNAGATVLYFDQGTYDVRTERGERIVAPVASRLMKIDPKSGAAVTDVEAPRSLSRFEGDVRETIRTLGERRQKMNAMAAERRRDEASIASVLKRNALLVALALLGLGFATWQLMRR
jgi:hypothetical protein